MSVASADRQHHKDKHGDNVLEGCYDITFGVINTKNTSAETQLGAWMLVLRPESSDNRHYKNRRNSVQFSGVISGVIDTPYPTVLHHDLVTSDRSGLIKTVGDTSTVTSVSDDGAILHIIESANPDTGTGPFGGLVPEESYIEVKGTLNLVTGLNDFTTVPDKSRLCFEEAIED